MVGRIYHVGLTVSDLDKSIAFYRDVLGLAFQGEIMMVGEETDKMFQKKNCKVRVAYLNGSENMETPPVELIQFVDNEVKRVQSNLFMTSISELCFYTDDIDTVYKKLIEKNVECLSEPQYFDFSSQGILAKRQSILLQGPDVLQKEELVSNTDKSSSLKAFATGDLVSIENVPDEAFASRAMGDGVAIIPTEKYITAPANGSVMMVMEETGHALGLKLDTDMEILIHIGIDTVNMKGDGFKVLVKAGDEVKVGDKLVELILEKIKRAGYNPITIMIATNFDQYSLLKFEKEQKVIAGKTTVGTY